jgi:hypothetical protein
MLAGTLSDHGLTFFGIEVLQALSLTHGIDR